MIYSAESAAPTDRARSRLTRLHWNDSGVRLTQSSAVAAHRWAQQSALKSSAATSMKRWRMLSSHQRFTRPSLPSRASRMQFSRSILPLWVTITSIIALCVCLTKKRFVMFYLPKSWSKSWPRSHHSLPTSSIFQFQPLSSSASTKLPSSRCSSRSQVQFQLMFLGRVSACTDELLNWKW